MFEVEPGLPAWCREADSALALLDEPDPIECFDPGELPEDLFHVPPPRAVVQPWDSADDEWLDELAALDPDRDRSIDELDVAHSVNGAPVDGWTAVELSGHDLASATEPEKLALVELWSRVESHAAAMKTAAVAAYARSTRPRRATGQIDPVAHEIGLALRLPLPSAQRLVFRARRLATHLPATFALLRAGAISWWHVESILDVTANLDQEACATVEARILPGADGLSATELRRRARRWANRLDPRDLRERHRAAVAQADVTVSFDDDGMGWLSAQLTATDALVVKAAADAYAARHKAAGDPRPLGTLRAEGLRVFAQHWLGDAKPTQHSLPVEVHVATTPGALAGLTDTPGEIPATASPIPIEEVRRMASEVNLRWLVICPDTGRVLYRDTVTYRPSPRQAAETLATYPTAATPHSTMPSSRADIDHVVSHASGGPTHPTNFAPFDRGWHQGKTDCTFIAKKLPDGSIEWTTPSGRQTIVKPYDYRLGP